MCASVFVLFDCSFLFYGCRQFRSGYVGNSLSLESVCSESEVEADE